MPKETAPKDTGGWDLSTDAQASAGGAARGTLNIPEEVQNFIKGDIQRLGGEGVKYPTRKFLKKIGYAGEAKISTITYMMNRGLSEGDPADGVKCGYDDEGKTIRFYKWDWKAHPFKKKTPSVQS